MMNSDNKSFVDIYLDQKTGLYKVKYDKYLMALFDMGYLIKIQKEVETVLNLLNGGLEHEN